jgi:hypothetical protein
MAHGTVALRLGGGKIIGKEKIISGNAADLLGPITDPLSGELALTQTRLSLCRQRLLAAKPTRI